ncbi:uncharacterized protein N7483_009792 [Penicillium malachiteum]|uniref:uncharacterized protein n=1 Tax=Penicillium malachiteum TaxID=1324776 RepID=UPI002548EAF7|nr:uncharacterized protein N7483_009792 [Penicillium malachiteum]KAJ5721858.1 hypothetical protein N7483_009792 [Penicillium malachiteum]
MPPIASYNPKLSLSHRHEARAGQGPQDRPLESISVLAPFSALILSTTLIVLFLIQFHLLEGFVMKRLYRRVYHNLVTTAVGTLCETIVAMWLFGSLWHRWGTAFKVLAPILNSAFSAAQVHGSFGFWKMYRRQQGYMNEEKELEIIRHITASLSEPFKPSKASVHVA